jgi:phage shock protein PspC (stress-responsive transcriptional regulator)
MNRLKYFIEWQLYGVCTALGERIGIPVARIRTWFIYITFLTMGSPLIVYFVVAFWMNMKRYITALRRNPLWYH